MGELIAIARLIAPFGIKGYLKVRLLTHDPERLKTLKSVFVGPAPQDARQVGIENVVLHHNGYVLKFDSTPDRTAAERFIGSFLFVDSADVARPPRGSYFVHEVLGCRVETADGNVIGAVIDVQKYPAQDVWLVGDGGKTMMIPAVKEFVVRVDIPNRRIIVQNVEGFREP